MTSTTEGKWRLYFLCGILLLAIGGITWRLIDLGVKDRSFLLQQSDARVVRIVSTPAYRGMITDRNGTPLAISTPVDSIWINPQMFDPTLAQMTQLAGLLGTPLNEIKQRLAKDAQRDFVYLKRGLPPDVADRIKALNIPGLFSQREYHRFYPEGEIAAHLIGFTNVDDNGQEGLELAYNKSLAGVPGKEEVQKDRLGHVVAVLNVISEPQQGHDLVLSLDDRVQYIAYRALLNAAAEFKANAASAVVLNAKTGEILAITNVPSYNPNHRPTGQSDRYRNRAVTDVFEPGSTMKPFSIYTALKSGKYTTTSLIDTNPGWLEIDGHRISDVEANNGVLTVAQVLQKSSNIGTAKMLLTLPPQALWGVLHGVGFGERTNSGFPGEVNGVLPEHTHWPVIDYATLAFGYGVSVTTLQLAQAYDVLANDGIKIPVTLTKQDSPPQGTRVLVPEVTKKIIAILETVLQKGGTATEARVLNYRVAGKTGTAYIAGRKGYDKHNRHYTASFVGFAPVSNPQLVVAVVLHDPDRKEHFGGEVAAPTFAQIMGQTLRLMDIAPDDLQQG
ncbi:MAG: penicillin-binding transpeptidase domain-containing protein [Gammaproteobacteria bacterium]